MIEKKVVDGMSKSGGFGGIPEIMAFFSMNPDKKVRVWATKGPADVNFEAQFELRTRRETTDLVYNGAHFGNFFKKITTAEGNQKHAEFRRTHGIREEELKKGEEEWVQVERGRQPSSGKKWDAHGACTEESTSKRAEEKPVKEGKGMGLSAEVSGGQVGAGATGSEDLGTTTAANGDMGRAAAVSGDLGTVAVASKYLGAAAVRSGDLED